MKSSHLITTLAILLLVSPSLSAAPSIIVETTTTTYNPPISLFINTTFIDIKKNFFATNKSQDYQTLCSGFGFGALIAENEQVFCPSNNGSFFAINHFNTLTHNIDFSVQVPSVPTRNELPIFQITGNYIIISWSLEGAEMYIYIYDCTQNTILDTNYQKVPGQALHNLWFTGNYLFVMAFPCYVLKLNGMDTQTPYINGGNLKGLNELGLIFVDVDQIETYQVYYLNEKGIISLVDNISYNKLKIYNSTHFFSIDNSTNTTIRLYTFDNTTVQVVSVANYSLPFPINDWFPTDFGSDILLTYSTGSIYYDFEANKFYSAVDTLYPTIYQFSNQSTLTVTSQGYLITNPNGNTFFNPLVIKSIFFNPGVLNQLWISAHNSYSHLFLVDLASNQVQQYTFPSLNPKLSNYDLAAVAFSSHGAVYAAIVLSNQYYVLSLGQNFGPFGIAGVPVGFSIFPDQNTVMYLVEEEETFTVYTEVYTQSNKGSFITKNMIVSAFQLSSRYYLLATQSSGQVSLITWDIFNNSQVNNVTFAVTESIEILQIMPYGVDPFLPSIWEGVALAVDSQGSQFLFVNQHGLATGITVDGCEASNPCSLVYNGLGSDFIFIQGSSQDVGTTTSTLSSINWNN